MPGKPHETRSAGGSGWTSVVSAATSPWSPSGGIGEVGAILTRSATMDPSRLSTDAFSPVPPTSIASVKGCSGVVSGWASDEVEDTVEDTTALYLGRSARAQDAPTADLGPARRAAHRQAHRQGRNPAAGRGG